MIRHFTQFILKRPKLLNLALNQRRFQVNLIKESPLLKTKSLYHRTPVLENSETPLALEDPLSDLSKYPHINAIIQTVKEYAVTEDEVKILMKHQPDLMNTSASSWTSICEALTDDGFLKDDILKVIMNYPQVLTIKKHHITNNLEAWFNTNMEREFYIEIISTHPRFLKLNPSYLVRRFSQLQQYFESRNRVGKMLMSAPNVLEEQEDVLLEKLNYLNNLCVDPSDIAASGVLAHTPLHIKARHEFLIRCGVYKSPQKDYKKSLSKNPKLERIVNTSDFEFATQVAKLTKFEYDVFLEMYEKESNETTLDYVID